MDLIRYMLPSTRALVVNYQNESLYSLRLITTRNRAIGVTVREDCMIESVVDHKKELSDGPVVVMFSGYGVIKKSRAKDESIVQRVMGDSENFLCTTTSSSTIRFVRLSQITPLIDELEEIGAKVIEHRCLDAISERPYTAGERATGLFARKIGWGELLNPSPVGSLLCMLICRKVKFPLLVAILLALLINFMNGQSLKKEYAQNETEIAILKAEVGRQSEDSQGVARLKEQYIENLPYGYAAVSDRIASLVPIGINLLQLTIQPLEKPLQEEQKPKLSERLCRVVGQAIRVESISRFLDVMAREQFLERIKLRSISQNTDNEMFHFVLDVEL